MESSRLADLAVIGTFFIEMLMLLRAFGLI
jgi:hypothetical protein